MHIVRVGLGRPVEGRPGAPLRNDIAQRTPIVESWSGNVSSGLDCGKNGATSRFHG